MKTSNLILIVSLCIFSATATGCKKRESGNGDAAPLPASFSEAEKNTVMSAIEAKKYDAAMEALGKLRDKVKTDHDAREYKAVMGEAMTRLRILSGDDDNAKAALSMLTQMGTGR